MRLDLIALSRKKSGDYLTVHLSWQGDRRLPLDDIYYIEVMNRDLTYHTADGQITERRALKSLEKELAGRGFCRCSASFLVNLYGTYAGEDKEMPVSYLTNTISSTYKSYSDAAIITLSRVGGEDQDLMSHDVPGHSDPNDHELMLLDNEKDLIHHVKQYFDKVIVLINSSNVMQISELTEEKTADNLGVDAILWIGGVGNSGAMAVGSLLTGEVPDL